MAMTPVDASTITDNFANANNAYWNYGSKTLTNGRVSGLFQRYTNYDPYGDYTGQASDATIAPMLIGSNGITIRTYAGGWTFSVNAMPSEYSQAYVIAVQQSGTTVQARVGGVPSASLTYDATAMAYWRIRTVGNTGYVDYSADRSAWTQVHSNTYGSSPYGNQVFHQIDLQGGSGGTLDDFNLTSAASGPVRKVSAYVGGAWTLKPVLSYIGGAWVEKPVAKYP